MGTFGKQIGGSTPSISQEKIVEFLSHTKFHQINIDNVKSTLFFMKFKEMYNGIPVFSRYTCKDPEKLKRCFEWLCFDVQKNGSTVEGYQHKDSKNPMEYNFKNHKINPIIFSLLNNNSLKSISTIDGETGFAEFEEKYTQISHFEKIKFTEVSPFTLDGELAEIALEGSVYCKWKEDAISTKLMTTEFVNKIIEGRFDDFKIYRTQECWSGHILGFFIAYFLFNSKNADLWILSKDDYD